MALSLQDVLSSKIYIKNDGAIPFQSPEAYITPFLESVQRLNPTFTVDVSGRTANKNTDSDSVNESFARIKIEAKLPIEYNVDEHDSVIGMVYGLDTLKPIMKIYSGRNAWACTNLAVFRADHLHQVEMLQGITSIYEKSKTYSEQVTDHIEHFARRIKEMKDKQLVGRQVDEAIGGLIRKSIQNKMVGTTPIMSAAQALYDKSSVYSLRDDRTTEWNLFSAVTQYITDKVDIIDKPTKTLYVHNMFETINLN